MSHPTLALKRAYLSLRRALEHTVKPFHFTGGQFDVLQLLMHNDGLEHRDLQRRLSIASPTLTNILDVLEREGHIERRSDTPDARIKTIHMSSQARQLCASDKFCAAGEALVRQMFDGFTDDERGAFLNALVRIETNLDRVIAP
ncbi:MarR family winged helix-turn-helix transcriptional regulator [Methylobacterium sp. NEAU K]|uniref:MarR family winged helix-turn-helix transcriptional regulator n=1 Tax=Methylobacterium sp. NEAU K TaxID=3064946 RepID=UPI002736C53D|nr:MarR family transcriptional regulator [Methylobacterium sp. NEAU K]MDP4004811.1 MarR family transcriptional regulator [Methylobacterium sp. NEAU K]